MDSCIPISPASAPKNLKHQFVRSKVPGSFGPGGIGKKGKLIGVGVERRGIGKKRSELLNETRQTGGGTGERQSSGGEAEADRSGPGSGGLEEELVGRDDGRGPGRAEAGSESIGDEEAEAGGISFVGVDGEVSPGGDALGDIGSGVLAAGDTGNVFPGPGEGFAEEGEALVEG